LNNKKNRSITKEYEEILESTTEESEILIDESVTPEEVRT
jgi:hypothetical protein